jgi:hypothetical protein
VPREAPNAASMSLGRGSRFPFRYTPHATTDVRGEGAAPSNPAVPRPGCTNDTGRRSVLANRCAPAAVTSAAFRMRRRRPGTPSRSRIPAAYGPAPTWPILTYPPKQAAQP